MNVINNDKPKFEIIGEYKYQPIPIGHGSFSMVYKGEHIESGKVVAIKKINITFNNGFNREKIEKEIEIMKSLKHKNIVQLYESLYDNYNSVFLIMEYCDGGNLSQFLNKKPLKEKYVKEFMNQICSAVKYLYQHKILHRDIKPQNIMMIDKKTIKLTDFGFAKNFQSDEETMAQTICGSPIYMAPEIIKCNQYSIKTDLWSIGVILYEMVIGRPPYKAHNHLELIHKIDKEPIYFPIAILVSHECRELINGLLQKDPNKRISWKTFFAHPWFSKIDQELLEENDKDETSGFNLSELIIDYDYKKPKPEKKKFEMRIPIDYMSPMESSKTVSQPIDIKKSPSFSDEDDDNDNYMFSDSYITSPMFSDSIAMTPNSNNGYIIVPPPLEENKRNSKIESNKDIDTERDVSESFIDYMSSGLNYFKTYYWNK